MCLLVEGDFRETTKKEKISLKGNIKKEKEKDMVDMKFSKSYGIFFILIIVLNFR